jgi:SAM-dependent methyltransferase
MEAAYDDIGRLYRRHRRPDPRLAARITAALGDARRVVNVGAGSGSYEPPTTVVAVEPSAVMAAQRPPGVAPVVRGVAERLPFRDGAFDAALAVLTAHHWSDKDAGLAELRRVSRRQVVFCTDLDVSHAFWLVTDYLPEIVAIEEARAAPPELIAERLGPDARIEVLPVPRGCTDGFQNAYWDRPEAYLDPEVQACMSTLAVLSPDVLARGLGRLRDDLASGAWHERHGHLLDETTIDGGYRLVVAEH